MAITSGLIKVILRYTFIGQKCETIGYYAPGGAAWLTASCVQAAEAWWQDIKASWRALVPNSSQATFDSVFVEEIGGSLGYGEYAVPIGEIYGTRSATGLGEFLPSFVAVGCKLSVVSRVTRPGQKRFPFGMEGDNSSGDVSDTFLALCNTLANHYTGIITLGAPVATGTLTPQVARFDRVTHALVSQQETASHVLNHRFTSQVSRRPGHGR